MEQLDLLEWTVQDEAVEAGKTKQDPARMGQDPARLGNHALPNTHESKCSVATTSSFLFLKEAVRFQTDGPKQRPGRDYRYLQRSIQKMLVPEAGKRPAVCACGHARSLAVSVHLIPKTHGKKRASVSGIYRCGNGEVCPTCARSVAALRARRYRRVHEAVAALGGRVLTFVLTIRHRRGDRLNVLLHALKAASTGARSGGKWSREIAPLLHVVGTMIDVHVRLSRRRGWHPHLHVSMACLTNDIDALRAGAEKFLNRYVAILQRLGHHASDEQQSGVILDSRPNAYSAHHHRRDKSITGELADEMDDDTSLSAFDIAELAAGGDTEMRSYFLEFAEAMRGAKCGVITAPMAKALGIVPEADSPRVSNSTRVGSIPSKVWSGLLDRNLASTFLEHVESFGREGWQRARWWALHQTGFVPPILQQDAEEIIYLRNAGERLDEAEDQQMAMDMIRWRTEELASKHDSKIVAETMRYVDAHWRHCWIDEGRLLELMTGVMVWADKRILRQRRPPPATALVTLSYGVPTG